MMQDVLTPLAWQQLQAHLSRPLDDNGKQLILDFISLVDTFELLEKSLPSLTDANIKKELIEFKKTAQSLIPKPLTPLSEQTANKMFDCYKALKCDVKAHLSYPIFLMTRNTATENLHPSQYDIAAKLALERLPNKVTENNKRGAGLTDTGNKHLYKKIWKLWHDLGETNSSTACTDTNIAPLVEFSFKLLEIAKIPKSYSAIRQNLTKYKKR